MSIYGKLQEELQSISYRWRLRDRRMPTEDMPRGARTEISHTVGNGIAVIHIDETEAIVQAQVVEGDGSYAWNGHPLWLKDLHDKARADSSELARWQRALESQKEGAVL